MSRDQKIILATTAAITIVFILFFLKPVLIEQYKADIHNEQDKIYSGQEVQEPQSDKYSGQEIKKETREDKNQEFKRDAIQNDKQKPEQGAKQNKIVYSSPLRFRSTRLLDEHYDKHGIDMGFASAKEYEEAAAKVPSNPNALHKTEKEDADDVYYIEETNEFVIVSADGYIRTYFKPDSGIKYFNRQ